LKLVVIARSSIIAHYNRQDLLASSPTPNPSPPPTLPISQALQQLHGALEEYSVNYSHFLSASLFQEICEGLEEDLDGNELAEEDDLATRARKITEIEDFSPKFWGRITNEFINLRDLLLRCDANRFALPTASCLDKLNDMSDSESQNTQSLNQLPHDDSMNTTISNTVAFTTDFESLKDRFEILRCLSILRRHVKKNTEITELVQEDVIEKYTTQIDASSLGPDLKTLLKKILDNKEKITIANFLASDAMFDIPAFQEIFKKLIIQWETLALGTPELLKEGNEMQLMR